MADLVLPTRALTLSQPWAWLVANGHKNVENRPRGFSHKSFRGDFWIHAGAVDDVEQFLAASELCLNLTGRDPIPDARKLAYGAIIGRATITGIIPPRTSTNLEVWDANFERRPVPWHFPDQYGFKVENAVALAKPVPCRGFQGFWTVPPTVLERLREAT